jgi:energy-coupling factor transport system ATP-binding protein
MRRNEIIGNPSREIPLGMRKNGTLVSNAIIVVEHLSHTYASGTLQKKALQDISLEIQTGSLVAIIGFNGSGKSTLIQHFNGLLRPTEGRVIVDGIDTASRGADVRALRQRVGLLFQFPESQLFAPSVFADVAFGPLRMKLGRGEVRRRVVDALDAVGLPESEYGRRSPFDLSGGQRRRVALAGVLAMQPSVLILDEPSVGLDGEARAEFYAQLRRVQQERGVTIILVSHDMAEVAAMADWLFVLQQGRLMMQGTPRDVFGQGEQLREWHLAVPALSELLTLLRAQGLDIPMDVFTLDEAVAFLRSRLDTPGARGDLLRAVLHRKEQLPTVQSEAEADQQIPL